MEEQSGKKKHSKKRRFYRKDKDKRDQNEKPEKQDKQEKSERGEKPDKPDKKEKSDFRQSKDKNPRKDRQKHHDKDHKGKQDKVEKAESADSEESADIPASAIKKEPEEVIFELTWADAWGLYGTGYHIIIKDNKERMYLSWSVDLKYGEMRIGSRLDEFLNDIKGLNIGSWDGKRYTKPGILDGDTWNIKVNSLIVRCEAQGTNEYPPEWKALLQCLHTKWNIPVSKREQWE